MPDKTATAKPPGLDEMELRSLVLWDCSVERGEAVPTNAGRVVAEISVEPQVDGDVVSYTVEGKWDFKGDETADLFMTIKCSFLLTYEMSGADQLSESEVESFSESVLLQVTPFQREFLATMTNRLGFPTFYVPLLRLANLERAPKAPMRSGTK